MTFKSVVIEAYSSWLLFSPINSISIGSNEEIFSLEDLGGYTNPYAETHFSAEEIAANLDKSAKAIANWLKDINDPIELDAIRAMADKMDLPASKLKVIQAKIPNRSVLESDEEE